MFQRCGLGESDNFWFLTPEQWEAQQAEYARIVEGVSSGALESDAIWAVAHLAPMPAPAPAPVFDAPTRAPSREPNERWFDAEPEFGFQPLPPQPVYASPPPAAPMFPALSPQDQPRSFVGPVFVPPATMPAPSPAPSPAPIARTPAPPPAAIGPSSPAPAPAPVQGGGSTGGGMPGGIAPAGPTSPGTIAPASVAPVFDEVGFDFAPVTRAVEPFADAAAEVAGARRGGGLLTLALLALPFLNR
jgi:hypothetical protein